MKKQKIGMLFLAIMLVIGAMVSAGTFALLTDTEANEDNSITAGTIDLNVKRDHGDYVPGPMFYPDYLDPDGKHPYDVNEVNPSGESIGGWAPGDTVTRTMIVTNEGSLDAKLTGLKATPRESFTQNLPRHPDGSRTISGAQITGAAYEEFIQKANVLVSIPDESITLYNGPLSGLIFSNADRYARLLEEPVLMGTTGLFEPGPLNVTFKVTLDKTTGNNLQDKDFIFDFGFFAEQYDNNEERRAEEGTASGRIVDAASGAGVSGLTLTFDAQTTALNNVEQNLKNNVPMVASTSAYTTTTDENGNWTITLPPGNYSVTVSGDNYITQTFDIGINEGEETQAPQQTVTEELEDHQTRIVLTWGAEPSDLDSHITGPSADGGRFHVYYGDSYHDDGSQVVFLDIDDTSSYGPETITTTINHQITGEYRYSIHDYSNRNSTTSSVMGNSGAKVTVYKGNQLVDTYNVPNQPGTLWKVLTINGDTITPINTMSFHSNPSSID
jgi:predicted ribosomally synthesized peptide with SipW-like signal peptide